MSTNTDSAQSDESLSYEIIIASTPEERQQCYDVRIEVFHHEQKFPLESEIDEMEDKATHFLLRLTPSLKPVGTVRAFKFPGKDYYKLTRLAVLKAYRRYRFGYALVQRMHEWVKQKQDAAWHACDDDDDDNDDAAPSLKLQLQGDDDSDLNPSVTPHPAGLVSESMVKIVLHSQIPAKSFYTKFGYEPEGPEFDEDGDPHQKMVLNLHMPTPMPLRPSSPSIITSVSHDV